MANKISSDSIFEKDASFPYAGRVYTIERKVPDQWGFSSMTPSQFDNYLVSSGEDQYILKMMQAVYEQKQDYIYDSDQDQQIDQEYLILKRINKHDSTLKCLGRVNIIDKFNNIHTSIILKKLTCNNLAKFFETKIQKLNLYALIELSDSLINSFLAFERQNIAINVELTLSYFGIDEDENLIITNGFCFCTVNDREMSLAEKETYLYKKNCAQIKSMVFAILSVNKELLQKYITPYNLQTSVDKIIRQNTAFQKLSLSYPKFESIFKDNNLISLKNFLEHFSDSLQQQGDAESAAIQKQFIRQESSLLRSSTRMERLQKVPSQIFKVTLQSEVTEQATPENKSVQYDISTITEDDEKEHQDDSQSFQIIDMKNQNKQENQRQYQTNEPILRHLITEEETPEQMKQEVKQPPKVFPKKLNYAEGVEIEMQPNTQQITANQRSSENKDNINIQVQQNPQVIDLTQNNFQGNPNQSQSRYSIQSQVSNLSEAFRRKADKLMAEEIEDISQQVKHKQKQTGDYQSRKKQLEIARQIEASMKVKEEKNKQRDEENPYSSGGSLDNQNQDLNQSARPVSESGLSDNLLAVKEESATSLISDKSVLKIMIGVLLLFIVGGIVFGVVFNFGVSSKGDEAITCIDTNCSYCATFNDVCTTCKSGFHYNSSTQKCVHDCSVSNCGVCITDYQVCESCSTGYTLYNNTCISNSAACPVDNCDSCTNLKCTACKSGYRLYAQKCYKTCTDSVCLSCPNSASVCTQCEANFTVSATNTCVSV